MEKKYPPTEYRLTELREAGNYPHSRTLVRSVSLICLILGFYIGLSQYEFGQLEIREVFLMVSVVATGCLLLSFIGSGSVSLLESRFSLGRKRYRAHSRLNMMSLLFLLSVVLIFSYSVFAFFDEDNSYKVIKYAAAALALNCLLLAIFDYFISRLRFNQRNAMSKEEILAEDG